MDYDTKSRAHTEAAVRQLAAKFQDLAKIPASESPNITNSSEPVQTSEFAYSDVLDEVKDKEVPTENSH